MSRSLTRDALRSRGAPVTSLVLAHLTHTGDERRKASAYGSLFITTPPAIAGSCAPTVRSPTPAGLPDSPGSRTAARLDKRFLR